MHSLIRATEGGQEIVTMAVLGCYLFIIVSGEMFGGELSHELVQIEPIFAIAPHQRFGNQR
jgi:hypothetical protein